VIEREVKVAEEAGDWDQAVLHYIELVRANPASIEYRAGCACMQPSLSLRRGTNTTRLALSV